MVRWLPMLLVCSLVVSSQGAILGEDVPKPSGSAEILNPDSALELLWNEGEFTEGVAVGPEGSLYFSDICKQKPGSIYRFDPKSGKTTVYCPDSGKSNGLMFDSQGRLLACCGANVGRRGLCEIKPDGTVQDVITQFDGKRFNAPNDIIIHQNGAIYFSDPRYLGDEPVELDHMSVFRFDSQSKKVQRVTRNITKPNGLALSPDGRTLYVAETDNGTLNLTAPGKPGEVRMTLNAFPVKEDGSLGAKQVIADFGTKTGIDGMTTDVQGHIYGALRNEDRFGIVVLTPQGKEVAFIPTPQLPTNCDFGIGEESSTLYVTLGGGLYRIRLRIKGHHPVLNVQR